MLVKGKDMGVVTNKRDAGVDLKTNIYFMSLFQDEE
jgi:hypothetical protein